MAFLKYSVLRIAFILVCALALKWAGATGVLLWILAIIFGMMLSFLLLRGERDKLTASLVERKERRSEGAEKGLDRIAADDAAFEDNL